MFEIYLDDLTDECKERLSKVINLKESNYDVYPLVTFMLPDEEGEL